MITKIRNWWKRRGERLCLENKHAWVALKYTTAEVVSGTGNEFAVNMVVSMFYSYSRCKRCSKVGRTMR